MNGKEYIEAVKQKLKLKSNYQLANELEITEQELSYVMRGERQPNKYMAFKFAEVLNLEPSIVIADIESESEKNPKRRDYFKSFMSTCTKAAGKHLSIIAFMTGLQGVTDLSDSAIRIMLRYAKGLKPKI